VFAFRDDVTGDDDKTPLDNGDFTYSVAGWYSDDDPLARVHWAELDDADRKGAIADDRFGFVVYAAVAAAPAWMLAHALVSHVQWDGGETNPDAAGYPDDVPAKVRVALGNTAVDALAAIVEQERGSSAEAALLEAFQYGLIDQLDTPGSAETLDIAIRRQWYGASSGGTGWTIVASERDQPQTVSDRPAELLAGDQRSLAALNTLQRGRDRQARVLTAMRWRLFALWWKKHRATAPPPPPVDDDVADWLTAQLALHTGPAPTGGQPTWFDRVQAQAAEVKALEAGVDARRTALETSVAVRGLTLKSFNQPEYHSADDPVLVVTGLGRSTNLDPVAGLTCRVAGQALDSLVLGGKEHRAVDVAPSLADPNGLLPDGVQQLHAESVLLSPELCAALALGDAGRAGDVQTALGALPAPAPGERFPPDPGAWPAWAQPWVPIVLEWELVVLRAPAYVSAGGDTPVYAFDQAQWHFDGTDWQWYGPTAAASPDFDQNDSAQMTLSGRTFVTPQISFALAGQVHEWVAKHRMRDPSLDKLAGDLDTYLDGIRSQDVLSQRLSGLRALLAQRDYSPTPAPPDPIAGPPGTDPLRGHPRPFDNDVPPPVWDFAPLAGTFFVVRRLRVTDFMGRTVDLLRANENADPMTPDAAPAEYWFYPIAGAGLRSPTATPPPRPAPSQDATQRMLQLPPRPVQEAQLGLRLTSNDGRDADVECAAGASPVCGWVVPNHLDRSLAIYAPDGAAWGELYLSRHVDGDVPDWQPNPVAPGAPATVAAIPNQYVAGMLDALVNRRDAPDAFADLLAAIDATLWTVDPRGARKDQQLSVLVGRPLAIVRAELTLRLAGLPYAGQDWLSTFAFDPGNLPPPDRPAPLGEVDGGVRDHTWPVRLGSAPLRGDGLVGYFADPPSDATGGFGGFAAVHTLDRPGSDYVLPVGDASYPRVRFIDDTVAQPDATRAEVVHLTMLVDPRGGVHAFTGLLPVVELKIPEPLVTPALARLSYVFRAGPLLSSPEELRIPRPSERKGTWAWFDRVLGVEVPVQPADDNVRLPTTPPLVREGWLELTPNPPKGGNR
jgi:hypothetical protein